MVSYSLLSLVKYSYWGVVVPGVFNLQKMFSGEAVGDTVVFFHHDTINELE